MDVLGSVPASFSRPLGAGGGGRFSFWSQSYFPFLLCLNRQIKGPISAKQTASSPLATDQMTGNKSNRKTSAPSGGSGSISDSSDPWQFLSSLPLPFFLFFSLLNLALILLLQATAGNTEALREQVQSSVFFREVTFNRVGQMICHLRFSHFSRSGPYSASGFVHMDSITNWLQSCCVAGVRDPIECPLSFFLKIRFVLKDLKMLTRL